MTYTSDQAVNGTITIDPTDSQPVVSLRKADAVNKILYQLEGAFALGYLIVKLIDFSTDEAQTELVIEANQPVHVVFQNCLVDTANIGWINIPGQTVTYELDTCVVPNTQGQMGNLRKASKTRFSGIVVYPGKTDFYGCTFEGYLIPSDNNRYFDCVVRSQTTGILVKL
jgi:hypothetical protein